MMEGIRMYDKINLYQKMNIILICLLVPILLLSFYSNRTSNTVVREEIEKSSETHLALMSHQIDASANQLTTLALSLNRDPSVRTFANDIYATDAYDRYFVMSNLLEKLNLISSSINWQNTVSVFAPDMMENVSSTLSFPDYNAAYIEDHLSISWTYHAADFHYGGDNYFMRHFVEPSYKEEIKPSNYNVITEVSFPQRNLVKILDLFKTKNNVNDPLLYKPGIAPILNSTSQKELTDELLASLGEEALSKGGSTKVVIAEQEYMATIQHSDTLGWYLIDYVPVETILAPIKQTSTIFYISIIILIVIGTFLSYTIYKNVQQPILMLVGSVRALMRGDYSKRINYKGHHEFQYLIEQFNLMAQQIQELIEKVYESRIRMQEATLKQLQSQIDPHFLYNCLNFIKNSARMKDEESVVQMSINLGEYYRYSTRLDSDSTPLAQELKLIVNYLEIHKLRLHELEYEIDVPESMLKLKVPRLLLQPVVENAIVHGIETVTEPGKIKITGVTRQGEHIISVEDNGEGMSNEEIDQLKRKIMDNSNKEQLCGLWNVSQRAMLQFGIKANVGIAASEAGGLKVTLTWPAAAQDTELLAE
jgi:two-component system sensor histidine kinase YesM